MCLNELNKYMLARMIEKPFLPSIYFHNLFFHFRNRYYSAPCLINDCHVDELVFPTLSSFIYATSTLSLSPYQIILHGQKLIQFLHKYT